MLQADGEVDGTTGQPLESRQAPKKVLFFSQARNIAKATSGPHFTKEVDKLKEHQVISISI